ncbi:MAG TPA: serine hydrolase domain-containing protein [Steroidobacteraceae bacterium]|nr:serine hydrolase domain-containing protein [Steroidobacteraceae bacterium]
MRTTNCFLVSLLLLFFLPAFPARADAGLQAFVDQTLTDVRARTDVPAAAVMVQINGKLEAQAAQGVRAVGRPESVTLEDEWHIGSDTKAMTATLIARLVEQGYLRYEDTMARIFPGIAARMNPALHNVTVAQLLSHTAGLPALRSDRELKTFMRVVKSEKKVRAQRAALVIYYLTRPPASKVGEFSYSNLGYVIAGAVAEERTGSTWEELMHDEIWKPLGIRSAGFGPPGRSGRYDQPLGHDRVKGKLVALDPEDPLSDNPVPVGPAGRVHISLADWMLFVQDQLDGENGHGKLLRPESYKRLHTPVTKSYAMGWGVVRDAQGKTSVLTHTGSNGYWVADVRIFPKHQLILLSVLNSGDDVAIKADKEIARALQDHLHALE